MRFLLTFFFFGSQLVVLQTIEMKTKERPEKKKFLFNNTSNQGHKE